jgi:16S rRNA (guanine527-N7)-methyltransferase
LPKPSKTGAEKNENPAAAPVNPLLEAGLDRILETAAPGRPSPAIEKQRGPVLELLSRYIAEIELFNSAYGLVKVKDQEELVARHILDSLAPLGILLGLLKNAAAPRIADVGSGAGLPGIPLAIAMPEARFTLIERMGRRAGFLRNAQAALSLSNVEVEEAEAEKAAPGRFDLVVFRAFRPLEPALVKSLLRLCVRGGGLAAYKGRRDTIDTELKTAGSAVICHVLPCPVPFLDEERHMVIIKERI